MASSICSLSLPLLLPFVDLVDFEDFESLQRRMQILEGIARGESAALEGRTLSHDQAKVKMKKWLS